jgi:DNA-binding response OmpR family regulator
MMSIKPSAVSDELAGARILVVEDENLIALDVSAMLTDAGAEVAGPATTARSATQIAQTEALSAATLDVRLGRETERIAAILTERSIPFLFYTGEALPVEMRARWPDCTVLVKPARQSMLVAAMRRMIRGHRS